MNLIAKLSKWISIIVILCSAVWVGILAFFAYSFTKGAVKKIRDLEVSVSLATEALASNWAVLIILSLLYFSIAIYLACKVKSHTALYILIAISSILVANIMNVLVVSAGFQLT